MELSNSTRKRISRADWSLIPRAKVWDSNFDSEEEDVWRPPRDARPERWWRRFTTHAKQKMYPCSGVAKLEILTSFDIDAWGDYTIDWSVGQRVWVRLNRKWIETSILQIIPPPLHRLSFGGIHKGGWLLVGEPEEEEPLGWVEGYRDVAEVKETYSMHKRMQWKNAFYRGRDYSQLARSLPPLGFVPLPPPLRNLVGGYLGDPKTSFPAHRVLVLKDFPLGTESGKLWGDLSKHLGGLVDVRVIVSRRRTCCHALLAFSSLSFLWMALDHWRLMCALRLPQRPGMSWEGWAEREKEGKPSTYHSMTLARSMRIWKSFINYQLASSHPQGEAFAQLRAALKCDLSQHIPPVPLTETSSTYISQHMFDADGCFPFECYPMFSFASSLAEEGDLPPVEGDPSPNEEEEGGGSPSDEKGECSTPPPSPPPSPPKRRYTPADERFPGMFESPLPDVCDVILSYCSFDLDRYFTARNRHVKKQITLEQAQSHAFRAAQKAAAKKERVRKLREERAKKIEEGRPTKSQKRRTRREANHNMKRTPQPSKT